jgi:1-acyl-sn-glycerol-3-phosphate acyltransferase
VPRPTPLNATRVRPLEWLASLAFTGFLFVSTLVFSSLVLALGWLPPLRRYQIVRIWAATELAALKQLCGLDYVVEGREHIPAEGGHVSMWKHSSTWETIAQAVILPPQAWVLKREILWIPLVGWATWLMRPIAIDRAAGHAAVNQVVQRGKARLAAGLWVLVFPEGTRVPAGQTKKYGISGALLAAAAGCKVVPVAHDAGRYWGRRGLLKKRGTIRVVIGPPIDAAGRDARAITEAARAWIDSTVARLGA